MKKISTIVTLLVLAGLFNACYKDEDYDDTEITADRLFQNISFDKESLLANDADIARLDVELPLELKDAYNLIRVKTTKGTFTETAKGEAEQSAQIKYVEGKQKRMVTFHLKSGLSTGTAVVEISLNNVATTREITLEENLPEQIKIAPAALFMAGGPAGELGFKTQLTSSKGKVSTGQTVLVSVRDEGNRDRGTMRVTQLKSDAAGENNFVFSIIPDTAYSGQLMIRAECLGFKDSVNIFVIK